MEEIFELPKDQCHNSSTMCGIIGYLDIAGKKKRSLGQTLLEMLQALACRGPDSSGVAVMQPRQKDRRLIARVKLSESEPFEPQVKRLKKALKAVSTERKDEVAKFLFRSSSPPEALFELIERDSPGIEVLSLGRCLEIVKQVGLPDALEKKYHVSAFKGDAGIGHTRLSTESRVDLSHSQPFGAHGRFDLATVHNGHITNYHQLRRQYEQRGIRFYTENDSEVLGVYLADHLQKGKSLAAALESSLRDLDGSFCYLVVTENELGFVKDQFALKPLVVGEGEGFVAIATEEIALRKVFSNIRIAAEPDARSVRVWSRHADN